jgi:hypothetical protein
MANAQSPLGGSAIRVVRGAGQLGGHLEPVGKSARHPPAGHQCSEPGAGARRNGDPDRNQADREDGRLDADQRRLLPWRLVHREVL